MNSKYNLIPVPSMQGLTQEYNPWFLTKKRFTQYTYVCSYCMNKYNIKEAYSEYTGRASHVSPNGWILLSPYGQALRKCDVKGCPSSRVSYEILEIFSNI